MAQLAATKGRLTNVHGCVSICRAAHVTGSGTEEAFCLIKAQHSIGSSCFLEQSINVLWSVPNPLGDQTSTVDHLYMTMHYAVSLP